MKISKTKLHQIISEEVSSLREAPVSEADTLNLAQQRRRAKRGQEKKNLEDFFGTTGGLGDPDTKTFVPPEPPPKRRQISDPWGLKRIRKQYADAEAARGGTRWGLRAQPPSDDDSTVKVPEPVQQQRSAEEAEEAAAKQVTHRDLGDPKRIAITDFTDHIKNKLIEQYEKKTDTTIWPNPLGSGAFGIVYEGDNPEYGPVAVKFTLSGQELNAYRNILKLKEGLWARDRELAKVLPTILNISTLISPPLILNYDRGPRDARFIEDPDGEKYKVFVVEMELLKKLDSDLRSDIFGPAAYDEYPPEVRQRFVDDYLTVENIYSSLEHLLGDMRWEKVLDAIGPPSEELPSRAMEPVTEGPTGRSISVPKSAQVPSLPIKDARAFPPFREIDKLLPSLRQAYLTAPAEDHFFALKDIHKILATKISQIFSKYIDNESLVGQLESSVGYMLPAQMAANTKLPQYDPEAVEAMPGLRSHILPPSELQSRVAKNFYKRLKKLEKYSTQYGDIHASNLMMRPNGDLVVADVGLFLFGPASDRGYAGTIAERFKKLAGLI